MHLSGSAGIAHVPERALLYRDMHISGKASHVEARVLMTDVQLSECEWGYLWRKVQGSGQAQPARQHQLVLCNVREHD